MYLVSIDQAATLLLEGDVVALPTETVYGLGGWINSEQGLRKIFSTKERPFFDPLIVHIPGIPEAKALTTEWTQIHEVLASACWPGPLTLVAKKNAAVNPLITAGLDSVGLRCPNHQLTLELLRKVPGGIAAPSANKFGKTSPTTAKHVYDEFGAVVGILEGGSAQIGIESTVAGVRETSAGFVVEIFRPGFYTASSLSQILEDHRIEAKVTYAESPVAPGQLVHHYMPKIPLVVVPLAFEWDRDRNQIEEQLQKKFSKPTRWKQPLSAHLASRELYAKLREFDQKGFDLILISRENHHYSEEWLGIWNRLQKAKSLEIT